MNTTNAAGADAETQHLSTSPQPPAGPSCALYLWLSRSWLDGADDAVCRVISTDLTGEPQGVQKGPLRDLCRQYQGHAKSWTVILPGDLVLLTSIQAPPSNLELFHRSLPYALEEQLVSDVETLHFATAPPDPDGWMAVAIVSRGLMDSLLRRLSAVGLEPTAVISELQAVPVVNGGRSLLVRDGQYLYRDSCGGLVVDAANPELVHALIRQRTGETLSLYLERDEAGDIAETLEAVQDTGCDVAYIDTVEPWQLAQIKQLKPLNLLQGAYAPVDRSGRARSWRRWLGGGLLVALLLQCGYWLGAGFYFSLQSNAAKMAAEARYRELFPEDKRIVNIRAQLQLRLEEESADRTRLAFGDFISTFATAWQRAAMSESLVKYIGFDGAKRTANVQLVTSSVSAVEPLVKALAANGLATKVVSVAKQDDRDMVRLQLEWRE